MTVIVSPLVFFPECSKTDEVVLYITRANLQKQLTTGQFIKFMTIFLSLLLIIIIYDYYIFMIYISNKPEICTRLMHNDMSSYFIKIPVRLPERFWCPNLFIKIVVKMAGCLPLLWQTCLKPLIAFATNS